MDRRAMASKFGDPEGEPTRLPRGPTGPRETVAGVERVDLVGKIFVFTGRLSRSRRECIEAVEHAGASSASSISKSVDYLVLGRQRRGKVTSTKIRNAHRLVEDGVAIKMINERTFWGMIDAARGHS